MITGAPAPITEPMLLQAESVVGASVPRLHAPSPAEFDRLTEEGTGPAVLTGCLDEWPLARAFRSASDDARIAELERLIGRRTVRYTAIAPEEHGQLGYTADGSRTNFSFSSGGKVPFSTFADVLRAMLAGEGRGQAYMQSAPLTGFPELLPHVPDLPYLATGAEGYRQLWIGSGGHVVNLHFDPTHNLIAMLAGRKRVTLIPPDNMTNMYPAPLDCRLGDALGSQVKLLDPDFGRHPRAKEELAKARVAEIGPGEVLYIPPMWWHHVESFGLNVMLNKWVLPVSSGHFTDLTVNIVRGLILFGTLSQDVRRHFRDVYRGALFAGEPLPEEIPPAPDALSPGTAPRVARHMRETSKVLRDVPAALRSRLPALYDYYVFQIDGPASLSNSDPGGFRRKLRLYAGVFGALRAVQALISRIRS